MPFQERTSVATVSTAVIAQAHPTEYCLHLGELINHSFLPLHLLIFSLYPL
ncbi:hypothetical protein HMPREF3214_00119 [Alloscardovia omnicolens]|nr:hypothetical protein HMPREF3214_00119 [Alloscardovia omnicolens]